MDVSFCLTSQSAPSPGHSDCLHGQTAQRCTAEPCDRTSRLQAGGLQIMKSYTLCTSARPHQPNPISQTPFSRQENPWISHCEEFIFRVKTLLGVISLTIYRGMQVKLSQDCNDRTLDTTSICNV